MKQSKWEEKCWGRVLHLFHSPTVALSYLQVVANTRCSIHRHKDRVNFFLCLRGQVVVERWPDGPNRYRVRGRLMPGSSIAVDAGEWHRFCVEEDGDLIEVYWPAADGREVRFDDIERKDKGGEWHREW